MDSRAAAVAGVLTELAAAGMARFAVARALAQMAEEPESVLPEAWLARWPPGDWQGMVRLAESTRRQVLERMSETIRIRFTRGG